jgi:adenosine deaminase
MEKREVDLHMENFEKNDLLLLTENLIQQVDKMESNYLTIREKDEDVDFFEVVQPFATNIQQLSDQWEQLTKEYIKQYPIQYIYNMQVESTVEQLHTLSVICFQKKSSFKKMQDLLKSVQYILSVVKDNLIEHTK